MSDVNPKAVKLRKDKYSDEIKPRSQKELLL